MSDKPILSREALLNGDIARLVRSDQKNLRIMSDEERRELVQKTLDSLGNETDLWVFGYGSLIWNPSLEFEEQRRCTIQGFHRKFSFWTTLSRGSEEQPGLMVGLVEGGNCGGVAYRIDQDKAATELDILFRREMSHFVYKPVWVEAFCVEMETTINTLTFVVDTSNEKYAEGLEQSEVVRTIALAEGPLGRNCDYLFQLAEKLRELGFKDPEMEELAQQVSEYQTTQRDQ